MKLNTKEYITTTHFPHVCVCMFVDVHVVVVGCIYTYIGVSGSLSQTQNSPVRIVSLDSLL